MEGDLRTRLIDAALAHVAEHGSRKTSLSDVARRAGVSRTTAYRIFGSKQGLIAAVAIHETGRFLGGLEVAVSEESTWESALVFTLEQLQGNAALQRVRRDEPEVLLDALLGGGQQPSAFALLVEAATAVIDRHLDTSILRVPTREASGWIAHAIISFLFVRSEEPVDVQRFGELILFGIAHPQDGVV